MRIAILVPCHDQPKFGFAIALGELMAHTARASHQARIFGLRGDPVHHAREKLVEAALASEADAALFWDTDIVAPPDGLTRLLGHGEDIVGASYATKEERPKPTGIAIEHKLSAKGLIEARRMGLGFVLIRPAVLRAIERPRFMFTANEGEDSWFFRKAREAGFSAWIDPALSEQIAHIGEHAYTLGEVGRRDGSPP